MTRSRVAWAQTPGLHRLLGTVFVALALAAPDRAVATPPANSTVPNSISLVGSLGSVPESGLGAFEVVVRDLANNPVAGAVVTVDLSSCVDLVLCAEQLDPSVTVDCTGKRVNGTTDAAGRVVFTLLGGSNGAGNAITLSGGGRIYANGILLGAPTVGAYDLDGVNGLGANDVTAFLTDFASGQNYGRSDYDGTGVLGAQDFAMWLTAFARQTQLTSCSSACP